MKVTETMRQGCLPPSGGTIAIKSYVWASAHTDATIRRVKYSESGLLQQSLESAETAGIITHPELGDVYAKG
jgi:hypothetical protein